jgi:hypothetical protein
VEDVTLMVITIPGSGQQYKSNIDSVISCSGSNDHSIFKYLYQESV